MAYHEDDCELWLVPQLLRAVPEVFNRLKLPGIIEIIVANNLLGCHNDKGYSHGLLPTTLRKKETIFETNSKNHKHELHRKF